MEVIPAHTDLLAHYVSLTYKQALQTEKVISYNGGNNKTMELIRKMQALSKELQDSVNETPGEPIQLSLF